MLKLSAQVGDNIVLYEKLFFFPGLPSDQEGNSPRDLI